jgi:hypothetical protein
MTDSAGDGVGMSNVQLSGTELRDGAIKSVLVRGADGATRTMRMRIPPGTVDGNVLRVPTPVGDVFVVVHHTVYQPRPRRRARLLLGVGALVAVTVGTAIIVGNQRGAPTEQTVAISSSAPRSPLPTTPPAESAAAYQQGLTALATAFNTGLTALNNAGTPPAIATAVTNLQNGLQQAANAVGSPVPVNADTANQALMSALASLTGTDLDTVGSAAADDGVCLGPAATAQLSRAASLAQLRTAAAALATLGYQFAAALPAVTPDGSRSVGTGTVVAGGVRHGLGQLTITNGGGTDATVGLVSGQAGAPVVTVYVGQGGTYTLHHVPDGTYQIYITSGSDWDAGARLFSRDCVFQQFDQPLIFTTTRSEYTTYTITLTPVAGGNATESDVDPGSFPH